MNLELTPQQANAVVLALRVAKSVLAETEQTIVLQANHAMQKDAPKGNDAPSDG